MRRSLSSAPSLKFNVDGAIFVELHSMGVGVIEQDWDWNGRFVAAMCKQIHAPLGPLEAESKAVKLGCNSQSSLEFLIS